MRRAGFTLIEVMVALAICGGGLIIILHSTSASFSNAQRAEALGIAAELARAKMYDIEEDLLQEGFDEQNQEFEGDFDDEGWPKFEWKVEIRKIELPNFTALSQLSGAGEDGEGGGEGEAGSSPLAGILGMFGGLGGGDVDPTALAGAGVIESQFELISKVIERSIRKVIVTVKWKAANHEETLTVDCYFTNPKAIDEAFGGFSSNSGNASGGSGNSGSNPANGGVLGGRSGSSGTSGTSGTSRTGGSSGVQR